MIILIMGKIIETKQCWRCLKLKKETDFALKYDVLRNKRLNICEECIKEEAKVLGESVQEIRGIYVYMQANFKYLDKSMYKRFWEKAIQKAI